MHFLDFLQTSQTPRSNKKRKRKKAAAATVGLLLACVSMLLSACAVVEDAAERPQGSSEEISENADHLKDSDENTASLSVESQTQQSGEQETPPLSGSVEEPQTESSEDAESSEETKSSEDVESVLTEEHELVYEGIKLYGPGTTHGSFFFFEDDYANLYMRRLRDHTGEYIELSLWRDRVELWHTVNEKSDRYSDNIEELCTPVFYKKPSRHFDLDQRMCYYVVEIDGMNYLMQYSVESASDAVTMSYAVFGTSYSPHLLIEGGYEYCLDFGSITVYPASDGAVDPAVSFPIDQMIAFADTVRGYMEKGQLVVSTLHGVYELGVSEDRNNPVSPYLYDIFPWLPELAAACGVDTEGIRSAKQMLTAIQGALPIDPSLAMPDAAADGTYFITGDYYGESDESYLTVRMREDGSYVGQLLIFRSIYLEFTGNYDNGILTVTPIDDPPIQLEISFQNGRATATITDVEDDELGLFDVGESYTMDRNAKPYELRYLKEAEERDRNDY